MRQKEIKCTQITNIEYLVSQYADDTSLLLDGSENSLRNTIQVLKIYAKISGLQIYIDKTKAMWICSLKNRNVEICADLGISFKYNNFKLLGIIFSKNLQDMVTLNYNKKIEE